MLHQRSVDRTLALEELQIKALELQPDEVVTYEELREITNCEMRVIYPLVQRLNRDLLTAKRLLINVRGVGYKLATVEDQLAHADDRRLRGMRQHRYGVKVLHGLDFTRLSEQDRDRATRLLDKMSKAVSYVHWNSQRTRVLAEKTLLQSRKTEEESQRAIELLDTLRKMFE